MTGVGIPTKNGHFADSVTRFMTFVDYYANQQSLARDRVLLELAMLVVSDRIWKAAGQKTPKGMVTTQSWFRSHTHGRHYSHFSLPLSQEEDG